MAEKRWESFADFINNATPEEAREVYDRVMERAVMRQRAAIYPGPCAKCVTPEYCNQHMWCYLGPTPYPGPPPPKSNGQ